MTAGGYPAAFVQDPSDRQCDLGHGRHLMGLVAPDFDGIIRPAAVLGLQHQQVGDIGLLPAGISFSDRLFVAYLYLRAIHRRTGIGDLAKRVIEQLKSAKTAEDLEGCVWIASDLLRKFRSIGYHSGFPEVDNEKITPGEKALIQSALIQALSHSSEPKFVSPIIDALGSAHDQALKPLFVDHLAQYLRQLKWSNGVVYAALLALHELDENVYERNPDGSTSLSSMEVDKNIRQAQKYLERFGIIIPL